MATLEVTAPAQAGNRYAPARSDLSMISLDRIVHCLTALADERAALRAELERRAAGLTVKALVEGRP